MPIRKLGLKELEINRANDRHGELENETAAIAWLFESTIWPGPTSPRNQETVRVEKRE